MDFKGLGYLVSILSVFLIGAVAWPTAEEPAWHAPLLIGGMTASIIGMGLRYISHLQEQRELKKTEAAAARR